jgi:hypothetical protein
MGKILKLHPPASHVSKPPRRCQKEFDNIWMLDVFTFSHIKTYLITITFEIFQAREPIPFPIKIDMGDGGTQF